MSQGHSGVEMRERKASGVCDTSGSEEDVEADESVTAVNDENRAPTKSPTRVNAVIERSRRSLVGMEQWASRGFAQTGILESIRVENFMCHRLFEFKFGPNVNIVNGNNGSGKSAIVAALQLGLGASAKQTERGRSTSDCIMHGESYAMIQIRIRNRPPAAGFVDNRYRPEVFGDAVVIEKRISRDGANSLKFLDSKNRKIQGIERPKDELVRLLDHFNIQVDNPVSILTQQRSKQFLTLGKPTDFYRFFMTSTHLDTWLRDIDDAETYARQMSERIRQKESLVPEIEKGLQKLRDRFEASQEMVGLRDRIEHLKNLYAWTHIAELEDELTSKWAAIDADREKLARFQLDLSRLRETLESRQRNASTKNTEIDSFQEAVNEKQRQLKDIQESVRTSKRELAQLTLSIQSAKKLMDSALKQVESLERGAEEEKRKFHDLDNERVAMQASLNGLLAEQEGTRAALKELENDERQAEIQLVRFHREIEEIERHIYSIEGRTRNLNVELKDLRGMTGNDVRRFGSQVALLLDSIRANESRFHHQPVGPIGQYLKVKDGKWCRAIQSCLRANLLGTFIVHDSHDERILRELSNNTARMITTRVDAPRYQVGNSAKPEGMLTILDAIVISESSIFNALLDHGEIERNVLVDSRSEFERIAYEEDIQNLKAVWLPDGAHGYSKFGSRVFRAGRKETLVLQEDFSASIREKEEELQGSTNELDQTKRKKRAIEHERESFCNSRTSKRRARESLRNQDRAKSEEIRRIQIQLEAEARFDATEWETRIASSKQEFTLRNEEREGLEQSEAMLKEKLHALEGEKTKIKEAGTEVALKMQAVADEWTEAQKELKEVSAQLKTLETRIGDMEGKIGRFILEAQEFDSAIVQNETENAKKLCPERLERAPSSASHVKAEFMGLEKRLQQHRDLNHGLSLEDIERSYLEAKRKKDLNDRDMSSCKDFLLRVQHGNIARRKRWKLCRKLLQKNASDWFAHFMAKRRNEGSLNFDNDAGELSLSVKMAHHRNGNGELELTTDLRSLSGGERSFTTLAFMLALGEIESLSLRIMDEFDVFMDEAHRRASYETLIDVAKGMRDRQFIFITPLELPRIALGAGEAIKVQKLNPPERNPAAQTRLDEFMNGSR
uniref:RecF/RecN/SMC N-terminal domain-containing protein n=1 Tax=Compsopogon caeruleus TaxID=31354 RepID=A0A6T6BUD9_9RHOD|eukprot:CAMPEP_0184680478 /NCGR_PEP_ID=MMETSP0312-20130426/3354_1 /TAXON_ID=31354 /ORGANISM="Compsopogon coeruleus, Strain SAG 36.94" /LENGTH=1131 /DNA_ID=CAMNT_0027130601 /DNA_START=83 /DNA_END=3478 /DNA_ORIENTATION=+